jgi:hypothetical protein
MSKGGNEIAFGDFGIQALAPAYVTNRQIEAARIAMTRYIKRGGRVWITIFPDRPLTNRGLPQEVQGRAVQPALPVRDRSARKYRPPQGGQARHRQDVHRPARA